MAERIARLGIAGACHLGEDGAVPLDDERAVARIEGLSDGFYGLFSVTRHGKRRNLDSCPGMRVKREGRGYCQSSVTVTASSDSGGSFMENLPPRIVHPSNGVAWRRPGRSKLFAERASGPVRISALSTAAALRSAISTTIGGRLRRASVHEEHGEPFR